MNNGVSVPNPIRARNQFRANVPNGLEATAQPLYDFAAYAAAGQTSLTFFQTPMGSGGKTAADTNMQLAGQLPSPQQFLLNSIEVIFYPGVSPTPAAAAVNSEFVNDVWAVGKGGVLSLQVMSKQQLQMAPIQSFPPSNCMQVDAALSDTTTAAATRLNTTQYACWRGPVFKVAPIMILASQNFSVTLTWPAAVALPSTVAGRIGIRLNGILYRAIN